MAHPGFGTTKRMDPLLEKVQTALNDKKVDVCLDVDRLKAEGSRLVVLKRAVKFQVEFLQYCNDKGINISRGLEKWLETK